MGALAVVLLWVGRLLLAKFIFRALAGAGLAFVSYHYAIGPLFDQIHGLLNGMPATALQWIGYLRIDQGLTVIASAYGIRTGMQALNLVKS